jgi:hypothetical protein
VGPRDGEDLNDFCERVAEVPATMGVIGIVFKTLFKALESAKQTRASLEARIADLEARPVVKDAGIWAAGTVYNAGDIVSHGGSGWICRVTHSSARTEPSPRLFPTARQARSRCGAGFAMTKETGSAWVPVFDVSTSRDELERIIAEQARIALVDVLEQIDGMGLSARERLSALCQIAPMIRAQTAKALTAAWEHLQVEAAAGQVH